jgi:hypothetical protein
MSRRWSAIAAVLAVVLTAGNTGPIRQLSLDREARVVDLFEGERDGQLGLRMVAQNPKSGLVFVTNRSPESLTVAVPKAVVGIHILPQFGQGPGLGNQNGFGQGNGLGNGQAGGGGGLGQNTGGTLGPMGNNQGFLGQNGANGLNPAGNGFFSIPPGKTVQLQLNSVCLSYGRPDPTPSMKYKLVRVEDQVSDPALQELLAGINERSDRDAVQAAAWHLANGLSWEQVAKLSNQRLPGVITPMFTDSEVRNARSLVESAKELAEARPEETPQPVAVSTPRIR